MAFFYIIKAHFLVYFSIPTALVYVTGYVLIHKDHLYGYVCMVYFWLTLYMGVATACLGYEFGFHLYGMSMIPIIHYSVYLSHTINGANIKAVPISVFIVICYLVSTLIPAINGPIYTTAPGVSIGFWVVNSITVFSFLIFYTSTLIKNIIGSEDRLEKLAMADNLTGLYNRHYMHTKLEESEEGKEPYYVAIVDIDDFKKVNDKYGHNAGDQILKGVADAMVAVFMESMVCRWGGEEFLILDKDAESGIRMLEELRHRVEETVFDFEGQQIKVTLTTGMASSEEAESIDKIIQTADDRLYAGKNSGKNKVVIA